MAAPRGSFSISSSGGGGGGGSGSMPSGSSSPLAAGTGIGSSSSVGGGSREILALEISKHDEDHLDDHPLISPGFVYSTVTPGSTGGSSLPASVNTSGSSGGGGGGDGGALASRPSSPMAGNFSAMDAGPVNAATGHTIINCVNTMIGPVILTVPFACTLSGWIGVASYIIMGVVLWWTGRLLAKCQASRKGLNTYPQIARAAFGPLGESIVATVLSAELLLIVVAFVIMVGTNMSVLEPLKYWGVELSATGWMIIFAACTFPSVMLQNYSTFAYLGWVSLAFTCCLPASVFGVWLFSDTAPATYEVIDVTGIPESIGVITVAYTGHAVFPTIFSTSRNPKAFDRILTFSFVSVGAAYTFMAAISYGLYGVDTQAQVTFNLPTGLRDMIAVATVIIPLFKFSLMINPVCLEVEGAILRIVFRRGAQSAGVLFRGIVRFLLVALVTATAAAVPFVGLVSSFTGALLSLWVCVMFPIGCYLKLHWALTDTRTRVIGILTMIIFTAIGILGTVDATRRIVALRS